MSELAKPAVTISLVTWNGLRWLPGCLDSVAAQTLDDYELLILDNGSVDGSVEWLRERVRGDARIRLVEAEVNLGFARAHNRHIFEARGEAVLLLNQDMELDAGFLSAATSVVVERPDVGSVQGRLRRLSAEGERTETLDTTALVMHRDRRVVSRGQLTPDGGSGQFPAGPVWGVDGAAPVYRRDALMGARLPASGGGEEVLDEGFFAYKEDVDLAWRLGRLGWVAWYEPNALAWHARGGGDTGASGWREVVRANMSNPPHVRALSWRNQRLMQVKNEESRQFLRDLPWIARRELQAWVFMLLADPRRLAAVPALLRGLPAAGRKRHALNAMVRARGAGKPTPGGAARMASLASRLRVTTVGRTVTHVRRQGFRSTSKRATNELRELLWVATHASGQVAGVRQVDARAISARLDRPRFDGYEGSPHLGLLGWASSKAGIKAVDVYLDGRLVKAATVGRSRPDVASAWRHLGDAEIEGFSAVASLLDTPPGGRLVSVVIRDGAGSLRILSRRFRRLDAVSAYQRFNELALAQVRPDEPGDHGNAQGRASIHLVVIDQEGADLAATLASIAGQDDGQCQCVILAQGPTLERARTSALEAFGPSAAPRWSVTEDAAMVVPAQADAGRLVGFLHAGETMAEPALSEFSAAMADFRDLLVYSDHDATDAGGQHVDPWFVPDPSPHRLLGQDYVGGVFLVRDGEELRAALTEQLACIGSPAWRYALLLELFDDGSRVRHVPRVLWSRPVDATSDPLAEAAAVATDLERRGLGDALVASVDGASGPIRAIESPLPTAAPLVSIIVPTTGKLELVADLLRLVQEQTTYASKELVVLDNSRGRHPDGIAMLAAAGVTVVERNEPFNWARLSNAGAKHARGELLLFLNDDMRATDDGWLDALVRPMAVPDVAVAGPMLLYPDGTIQHAGIILVAQGGGAAHLLQGLDPQERLYLDLQHVTREVSAVTGACLLVRRDVFEEVGGFDERFEVSGNDVDFCLRVRASGHRVLWTPQSVLLHEEGRSRRGVDYVADESRFWERWGDRLREGDPYFNPNLSQDRTDCDLDWTRLGN